jgi:hypothetical protein
VPLLPWYLGQLAQYEQRTGQRILDVVDVHFYPQADGVYNGSRTDPDAAALRIRSTRALWDPEYRDESWIKEHINLIPRLKDWIANNYPGRQISIGEWNFGGENHISGALAIAEVLGRFGQQGIKYAFYWNRLAPDTPAYWAFRAYRNFDGEGGRFLDTAVPTKTTREVSLFASKDDSGNHLVAILLNLDPTFPALANVDLSSCGTLASRRVFSFGEGSSSLVAQKVPADEPRRFEDLLVPYSLEVVDMRLSGR